MSKFDQFIEDFDKTLNKDTSTIKTLTSPTTPPMETGSLAPSISNNELGTPASSHQRTTSTSTSASQSTPTKPRASSVSLHPLSPNANNNGSARKKGLNLNIAMGSRGSTPRKITSTNTPAKKSINNNENTIKEGEGGELQGDMSDVLRKMASSEMKIIELKDELRLLQKKIQVEEEELAQLRSKVAWNLNHQSKPKKQGVLKKDIIEKNEDVKNEKGSYWSKPMTLLNQFDQMLQTEFEKLGKDQTEKDNDVLKGVSNSLWSFVSDVKSGLMGDEDFQNVGSQHAVMKKRIKNNNKDGGGDKKSKNIDEDEDDEQENGKELVDFGNT